MKRPTMLLLTLPLLLPAACEKRREHTSRRAPEPVPIQAPPAREEPAPPAAPETPPPSAPGDALALEGGLTPSVGGYAARLAWEPVAGAERYEVWRREGDESLVKRRDVEPASTRLTFEEEVVIARGDTVYTYEVRVVGESNARAEQVTLAIQPALREIAQGAIAADAAVTAVALGAGRVAAGLATGGVLVRTIGAAATERVQKLPLEAGDAVTALDLTANGTAQAVLVARGSELLFVRLGAQPSLVAAWSAPGAVHFIRALARKTDELPPGRELVRVVAAGDAGLVAYDLDCDSAWATCTAGGPVVYADSPAQGYRAASVSSDAAGRTWRILASGRGTDDVRFDAALPSFTRAPRPSCGTGSVVLATAMDAPGDAAAFATPGGVELCSLAWRPRQTVRVAGVTALALLPAVRDRAGRVLEESELVFAGPSVPLTHLYRHKTHLSLEGTAGVASAASLATLTIEADGSLTTYVAVGSGETARVFERKRPVP